MSDLYARRGVPGDLNAIVTLETMFPEGDRMSPRSWRRLLAREGWIWVCEIGGEMAGAAALLFRKGSSSARLYSLSTAEAFRGRGVARRLVEACARESLEKGCTRLRLEVHHRNDAAIALYRGLGFEIVREKPRYYADGGTAFVMSKQL